MKISENFEKFIFLNKYLSYLLNDSKHQMNIFIPIKTHYSLTLKCYKVFEEQNVINKIRFILI